MVPLIAGLLGLLFFVCVAVYVFIREYRARQAEGKLYRVFNGIEEFENLTLDQANGYLQKNEGFVLEPM